MTTIYLIVGNEDISNPSKTFSHLLRHLGISIEKLMYAIIVTYTDFAVFNHTIQSEDFDDLCREMRELYELELIPIQSMPSEFTLNYPEISTEIMEKYVQLSDRITLGDRIQLLSTDAEHRGQIVNLLQRQDPDILHKTLIRKHPFSKLVEKRLVDSIITPEEILDMATICDIHEFIHFINTSLGPFPDHCAECQSIDVGYKCSKCQIVLYCSPECQSLHWKDHKKICKKLIM